MARARRVARTAAAAALAGALAGCYRAAPVPPEGLRAPERVRVALAPAAAERVSRVLGAEAREVSGEVVATDPGGLTLRIPTAYQEPGVRSRNLYQEVVLAPGEVLGVQVRELDRGRTALLAGGAAAAVALIASRMLSGETGGMPPTGDGGSAEVRIPVLNLSVR